MFKFLSISLRTKGKFTVVNLNVNHCFSPPDYLKVKFTYCGGKPPCTPILFQQITFRFQKTEAIFFPSKS